MAKICRQIERKGTLKVRSAELNLSLKSLQGKNFCPNPILHQHPAAGESPLAPETNWLLK
jgi:hypothetical protein